MSVLFPSEFNADPQATEGSGLRVAVLIPCFNEAAAIGTVVRDFSAALPQADIYVYDNNSSDGTAEVAARAGAIVRREPRQGKGHVVRRMFADVEADIFVMVDGDDTYDAAAAPAMVSRLADEGLDLVNGVRVAGTDTAYRPGHKLGNQVLSGLVRTIFGRGSSDMLSGFRVFSRRFVKTFPMMSRGFEIETELTVHALELGMPTAEVPGRFKDRPDGSESKLNSIRDGLRILSTITRLLKQERPFLVFSTIASVFAIMSLTLAGPVFAEYFATGLVPRLPTAVLSASLMILAFLMGAVGLILDTVTRGRQEAKRMQYLSVPGVLGLRGVRRDERGPLSPRT
ncbi:glycosyltransferase family 2 protein [Roseovarius sp.]|uniref:glycosyltransferase family 2 protein n=1 Tax=Roseovarius sp. TaxID=1486281 RepID=UPI003B59E474